MCHNSLLSDSELTSHILLERTFMYSIVKLETNLWLNWQTSPNNCFSKESRKKGK